MRETLFNLKAYRPLRFIGALNTRGLLGGLSGDDTSQIFVCGNAIRKTDMSMYGF